jgi:ATP-dependent RNA helicase DHX37/DHR1
VFAQRFPPFPLPEVQRLPLEEVVLRVRALGVPNVASFPFPSPPPQQALVSAQRTLTNIGALAVKPTDSAPSTGVPSLSAALTPLGVAIADIPLAPRFAKMLVLARQMSAGGGESAKHIIMYAAAVVAAISVQNPLLQPTSAAPLSESSSDGDSDSDSDGSENKSKSKDPLAPAIEGVFIGTFSWHLLIGMCPFPCAAVKSWHAVHGKWRHPQSDALSLLRAVGAFSFMNSNNGSTFCKEHSLHFKVDFPLSCHFRLNELILCRQCRKLVN